MQTGRELLLTNKGREILENDRLQLFHAAVLKIQIALMIVKLQNGDSREGSVIIVNVKHGKIRREVDGSVNCRGT